MKTRIEADVYMAEALAAITALSVATKAKAVADEAVRAAQVEVERLGLDTLANALSSGRYLCGAVLPDQTCCRTVIGSWEERCSRCARTHVPTPLPIAEPPPAPGSFDEVSF